MWWPGNPNGSAEEAVRVAEALTEAAKIAAEWAKDDTTNEIGAARRN